METSKFQIKCLFTYKISIQLLYFIKKKKRYWENDQYFDKRNGPVFLMIGGEGEEDPIWMTHGSWISYAQKFVSLLF